MEYVRRDHWLRNFPGLSRWSCPTISSSVRGRIRSARGWLSGVRGGKRLCDESALRRAIFNKYHSDRVRLMVLNLSLSDVRGEVGGPVKLIMLYTHLDG